MEHPSSPQPVALALALTMAAPMLYVFKFRHLTRCRHLFLTAKQPWLLPLKQQLQLSRAQTGQLLALSYVSLLLRALCRGPRRDGLVTVMLPSLLIALSLTSALCRPGAFLSTPSFPGLSYRILRHMVSP